MSGLIGKKIGMTSLYDNEGKNLACTVIEAGPCIVTQVKNKEKDGYNSIQLGFHDKKESRVNNAEIGHSKKANTNPKKKIVEFNGFDIDLKIGDKKWWVQNYKILQFLQGKKAMVAYDTVSYTHLTLPTKA